MMENKNIIDILYEDEDYLIIDKPYDLVINSDDETNQNTVHRILIKQLSLKNTDNCHLKHGFHFVNRLDFSTSGVMCLAKNKKGARVAGDLFECRKVTKIYTALVRGHLDIADTSVDVNVAIGYDSRHLNDNKMMCTDREFMMNPKECRSRVVPLEIGLMDGEEVTRVVLIPLTGRRHQLRVHCRHIGHPIVGDYTYSNGEDISPGRMYLHAYRLILPLQEKAIDITAPDGFSIHNWKSLKIFNTIDNVLLF